MSTDTTADEAELGLGVESEREAVEVEHAPPRLTQAIAAFAALVGVGLSAPFTLLSLLFGGAGFVIVVASLFYTYSRGWLSVGTGMMLLGALIAGGYGVAPPELLLVAIGATLVAWDAGQHGIVIGEQLGRQSKSRRAELIHILASTLVIGLASAVAYLAYLLGLDGRPAPAVALVAIGLIIVAWMLRS